MKIKAVCGNRVAVRPLKVNKRGLLDIGSESTLQPLKAEVLAVSDQYTGPAVKGDIVSYKQHAGIVFDLHDDGTEEVTVLEHNDIFLVHEQK